MGEMPANPAPLGLFSFALTTFIMSCYQSGIWGVKVSEPTTVVVGVALFYGGFAQFIAGMWEFIRGSIFGATAFTSYGAFWISNGVLLVPWFGVEDAYRNYDPSVLRHAKAIFLLGWTIFTLIMTFACFRMGPLRLSFAFLAALITFSLLTAADFLDELSIRRAGGFSGLITSGIACYDALADLLEAQSHKTSIAHSEHGGHVIEMTKEDTITIP